MMKREDRVGRGVGVRGVGVRRGSGIPGCTLS